MLLGLRERALQPSPKRCHAADTADATTVLDPLHHRIGAPNASTERQLEQRTVPARTCSNYVATRYVRKMQRNSHRLRRMRIWSCGRRVPVHSHRLCCSKTALGRAHFILFWLSCVTPANFVLPTKFRLHILYIALFDLQPDNSPTVIERRSDNAQGRVWFVRFFLLNLPFWRSVVINLITHTCGAILDDMPACQNRASDEVVSAQQHDQ